MNMVKQSKLIDARKNKGLSREKAALQIKISAASWVSYESGHRMPSLPVAFKIARLLNIPVEDLFICPESYFE